MSVTRKALLGIAWVAGSNWLTLGVGALTFSLIVTRLAPAEVGLFGAAGLAVGLAGMLFGGPLNESLEQREDLRREHVNATFWIAVLGAAAAAAALIALAGPVAQLLRAPQAVPIIMWSALTLPVGAATGVMRALMVRDQRFGDVSKIGVATRLAGNGVSIGLMLMGAGVWALVIADLMRQALELALFARASRYRPQAPRRLGAIGDLMKFNLHTLATYGLGYLDSAAPSLLTSAILGPQALGYLMMAGRVLDQVHQLVLQPLGAVTMTSVARLQSDPKGMRDLIRSLYSLAALVAYPAFLGAVVIMPPLAQIAGPNWIPATLTSQLLLLMGLRLATGSFNLGILRGMGRTELPLLLLASGAVLQLILCPIGAQFGAAGVAAAGLIRTFATWPLGCVLIKRATGVGIGEQLAPAGAPMAAALVMAAASWGAMLLARGEAPLTQVLVAILTGAVVYPLALAAVSAKARRVFALGARTLDRGQRGEAISTLRAELGV